MMQRSIDRRDEAVKLIKENYHGAISFPNDLESFQP